MNELTWPSPAGRGDRGKKVRRVQEWLSLRGYGLVVDGDFGAATDFAVREFQEREGLPVTGHVDETTFGSLARPIREIVDARPSSGNLGSRMVFYARRHVRAHPREIGGQNRGPWVRHYMDGNEGPDWPWCAGFVCTVMRQACDSLGVQPPIVPSVSCDTLAASGKTEQRFIPGTPANRTHVRRGDLFLVRRTSTDWTHVGIVVKTAPDVMLTIEGNTNDVGDREGYEACQRIRGYSGKDFISLA